MELIKIGDSFRNYNDDIHVVTKISKTALIIHAKNIKTGVIERFRWYEASGQYIIQTSHCTSLGKMIKYN